MAKSEGQQPAEIIREVENRLVWLAAFLVNRGTSRGMNSLCGKAADEALAEYQQRFSPLQPPD